MNRNKRAVKAAAAGLAVLMAGNACFGNTVYAANQEKEETVYVKANADGTVEKTIVSNWLKNEGGAQEIKDESDLTDIKNVKGDEEFSRDGKSLTWQAAGNDIYYQGETDKELPVGVKITYFLEGKEITAEELEGKSGKVRIRFDYTNSSRKGEVYTPFTMVTGVILPTEKFTNVEAENGKVISDGSKNIVVGMGFPGLAESLKLSESELTEDLKVPDYFEITADAEDFSLSMTATVAASGDLSEYGLDDVGSLDDLKDSLDELQDASAKLVDGSGELADGVQELRDACGTLLDGMNTADEKMGELADGIGTLDGKKGELIEGLNTLANGLDTLDKKKGTLKKGVDGLKDGLDTLNKEKGSLTKGINTLSAGSSALKTGGEALKAGIDAYTAGTGELAKGVGAYTAGTDTLAAGVGAYVPGAYRLAQGVQALNGQLQQAAGASQAQQQEPEADKEAGKQLEVRARAAKGEAENLSQVMELADGTISSLSVSIEQNQAVLDTLEDVQGRLGEIPGALIAGYSDTYQNYVNVLNTDISYLKNDIRVQKKALKAWEDFKVSANVETLNNTLDSIGEGAAALAAPRAAADTAVSGAAADPSVLLAGVAQTVSGMAEASAPLADQAAADALVGGATQLAGSSDTLRAGAKQLTDKSGELQKGAKDAAEGAASLDGGIGQVKTGTARFMTGIETLAKGGAKLQKGVGALNNGIDALAKGGGKLQGGAGTLSDGIGKLAEGSSLLKNGTAELAGGGTKLTDGVDELLDGAGTLRDGMEEFDKDGIQELTGAFDDGVQKILDRIELVADAGKSYQTFSGAKTGMKGKVKFIIETGFEN